MNRGDAPVAGFAVRSVSKRFGGVQALAKVSLAVEPATVHAVIGENGAGKSTVGKVFGGAVRPDRGCVAVDGRQVSFTSPREALHAGIARISQEVSVVPEMSVIENVFVGQVPSTSRWTVDTAAMRQAFEALEERTGFLLPPKARVAALPLADQQKVEILRAVARGARLIVMDEATAALAAGETARLLTVVRGLADVGTSVLLVTHFLDEVLTASDHVTIMRDGRVVRTGPTQVETPDSLVEGMLGIPADVAFPAREVPSRGGPVVLRVAELERRGVVGPVSFDVAAGEIVGIAGLAGSGRSELLRAVFGADRRTAGRIEVDGVDVSPRTPGQAVAAGIAMVPESRKSQGLHLQATLRGNIILPSLRAVSSGGFVKTRRERALSSTMIRRLDIQPPDERRRASDLSGGNQQRLLFAKWLAGNPRVLLADEPTRGVDVGGKRKIYELLASLATRGLAIVMVSSAVEEIVGLADRVIVMRQGHAVGELTGRHIHEAAILQLAFGNDGGCDDGLDRD